MEVTNNIVRTQSKRVYGEIRVYPHKDCSNAVLLAQLVGNKTFNESNLKTIAALGYTIQNENVL